MAKRIYEFNYKKWGTIAGISIGTIVGLLFAYLSFLGAIEITGYSGDVICDGTIEDPCYAYINLTAKEDVFIYPIGYDPWGRNTTFLFSPGVKDWKLQRSWGNGWRDIPLDKTCTGTWCGAPDNKGVAYSYVLRDKKEYQFRIVAYKNSPFEIIKWAVDYENKEYLDPTWKSQFDIPELTIDKLLYIDYQNALRESDSLRVSNKDNSLFKSYNASEKTLLIEDNKYKTLVELKLLTNYKQHVGVGNDTIIARMNLIDFLNSSDNLFDKVDGYDVKNNYESELKIFILKYRTDWIEEKSYIEETFDNKTNKSIDSKIIYYNQSMINWTEFTKLNQLPHKNIEIGIFTDTILGEYVEWVPVIQGFEIQEWASYLVTGLVSYYNFDNNYADSLGINNATNSNTELSVAKINNGALYTSGDYIDTNLIISALNSFTVSGWVNMTVDPTQYSFIYDSGWYYSGGDSFFMMYIGGATDKFYAGVRSGVTVREFISNASAPINNWYHIVVTSDGTYLNLYQNGVLVGRLTANLGNAGDYDMYLGRSRSDTTSPLTGKLDEVGVWNIALNSSSITDLYNAGVGLSYPFEVPPSDTCTCAGAGNNWAVNMSHYCNLTSACTLTTGNLSWVGTYGYFNCSANLNLTNRNAPPSGTTFYFSNGCQIIHLIIMLFIPATIFKKKRVFNKRWT